MTKRNRIPSESGLHQKQKKGKPQTKTQTASITVFRDEVLMNELIESRNTKPFFTSKNNKWSNPLPNASWSVPIGKYHPGGFAFVRKQSVHTGVDLYCSHGEKVVAVEDGMVVAIEYFTGPEAASPWYNTTMAVMVEGVSGVVLYGEIKPNTNILLGKTLKTNDSIGEVVPVLKKDKGNGTSMLHIELYRKGTRKSVWWEHGHRQPARLRNPTDYLLQIITTVNP